MVGNIGAVLLLNILIDGLLFIAAGRVCNCWVGLRKAIPALALDGVYTYLCLQSHMYFLGNPLLRVVCLLSMAMVTYGISVRCLRVAVLFAVMNIALGGSALSFGNGSVIGAVCSAGVVCLVCCVKTDAERQNLIPVELTYGNKCLHITALRDTGNGLRDPLTGQQVLVVGGDVAGELTGLTKEQLKRPVESVGALAGLRLIPYRTVDSSSGFLLALKLRNAKVGSWRGSAIVAFAPESLNREGTYQALTGGML